ncbi:MAG: shikimate dehydrogenase [Bacteroidales bacterium]|nr:MAG: shikimate dehydrogenase [Bacteroidales bacterium]
MTKLFAVFGNPVLHSKSPQLFNSLFERFQIDAHYTRIHVETGEEVIRAIRSLNIIGANITTPFKECIIPMLDELSKEAEQIGAVNTILNDNGYLKGFNTDYLGVVKSIEAIGVEIFGKQCLVIGAGGASRAAVFGLMNAGAEVFVANRTASKAVDIANHLGCNVIDFNELSKGNSKFNIVVSTLLPDVSINNFSWDSSMSVLLDANYRESKFSDSAASGIKVVRGDRWLINQAIGSFSIFTSLEPSVDIMNDAIHLGLDYNQVKIGIFGSDVKDTLHNERYDFLVSSVGLNPDDVKRIIDEEKHKVLKG